MGTVNIIYYFIEVSVNETYVNIMILHKYLITPVIDQSISVFILINVVVVVAD